MTHARRSTNGTGCDSVREWTLRDQKYWSWRNRVSSK